MAVSFEDFAQRLLQRGITVKESRGRLSYLTPDRAKPITARKLGDDFDRAAVGAALERNAARRRELEAAQKRIGELNSIFKRLYEDSVSERITDERFMELSADYEQEQATLKARVTELQTELGQAQEAAVNVEKFMAVVRKYTSFEELTPTLLREFVEKIVVHKCWKDEQGTRHQDIEIYYSFVGKVDLPDD